MKNEFSLVGLTACQCVACSRLRDGGGKSFSNTFPKSCASYFHFVRFNTFPLYYLRAWHRLVSVRMVRVIEKVFRNSSEFRFNVSFVDWTSVS